MSHDHDSQTQDQNVAREPAGGAETTGGSSSPRLPGMMSAAGATYGAGVLQRKLGNRQARRGADAAPVQAKGDAAPGRAAELAHAGFTDGAKLPHLDAVQESFGRHDVRGVRATVGGAAAATNEAMGSTAYASGNNVAFRGAPDLHTAAHEAAHVVQQRAGVVQFKDGVGRSGDAYERHADAVADAVVAGRSAQPILDQMTGGRGGGRSGGAPVQFLGGNANTEVLARFGGTGTVAERLHASDAVTGVVRDRNHNNALKVRFENALANAVLSSLVNEASIAQAGLHQTVQRVSRGILAYINAKAGDVAEQVTALLNQLTPENQLFFGSRLPEELGDSFAARMRVMLGGTGAASIPNHMLAHATFITKIYAGDFRDQRAWLEGRVGDLIQRVNAPNHLKEPDSRIPLSVGGSVTFREAHNDARIDPSMRTSAYQRDHRAEVPTTGVASGIADRPRVPESDRPVRNAEAVNQPPALGGEHPPPQSAQVHERGTDRWTANEASAFVQDARLMLDMPVSGAGASGNTAELMNCAQMFGVTAGEPLLEYALGVLGYLIGGGAHTFHEIMTIAAKAGVPYRPGDYRGVMPASFRRSAAYRALWDTVEFRPFLDPALGEHDEEAHHEDAHHEDAHHEDAHHEDAHHEEAHHEEGPAPGERRLPGIRSSVTLHDNDRDNWRNQVAAFLAGELGVAPEQLALEELAGGRSQTPVYRVAVEGAAIGVFKVFPKVDEAESEVKMLRLLASRHDRMPHMRAVGERGIAGVNERAHADGRVTERGGLMMAAAEGRSVDGMIGALRGVEGPAREEQLVAIEAAVGKVGRAMKEMHAAFTNADGPAEMAADLKDFDRGFYQGKLDAVRAQTIPAAVEPGEPRRKLTDANYDRVNAQLQNANGRLYYHYRRARVSATAAHGDANAGNFITRPDSDVVSVIDVATMEQSLTGEGKSKKTGGVDAGRYLQSLVTSHPGVLADDEHTRLVTAFRATYFDGVAAPAQAANDHAIRFYRLCMEIVALEQTAGVEDINRCLARIGGLVGQALDPL